MSDVSHSKRITLETYDSEWGRGKRGGGRDLKEGEKCGEIYTGDPEVSQASIDLSYYCRSPYTSADDILVCRGTAWYLTDDQYRETREEWRPLASKPWLTLISTFALLKCKMWTAPPPPPVLSASEVAGSAFETDSYIYCNYLFIFPFPLI